MNTNDNKILSHSVWNCKYHIVFAPKYRRKYFTNHTQERDMQFAIDYPEDPFKGSK